MLLNGNTTDKNIQLPPGTWTLAVDGNIINENGLRQVTSTMVVPATTAFVLYKMD